MSARSSLYRKPVISLAVLCNEDSEWRPNRFSQAIVELVRDQYPDALDENMP